MNSAEKSAVYIHWPFCKSKCPYCDFYKEVNPHINQDEIIDEYIAALRRYHEITAEREITSIFFGGGTPSLIHPANIARIIDYISQSWHTAQNLEISLEANPNTYEKNLFADFKTAGINRLSLGVQALNTDDLHLLGRTHSLTEARQCLEKIVTVFDNCSADLIYARPQQKIDGWVRELEEICRYGLTHISAYELTIEEGTVFARRNVIPADEETALKMTAATVEILEQNGYHRYEISNYARRGCRCRHNLVYWQGDDYIGIGKSAHGRLRLNGKHIATVYPFMHEELSAAERAEELIIMGLRLTDGINKHHFTEVCGLDFHDCVNPQALQQLIAENLLAENKDYVYATADGLYLLNEIVRQLCG